jgi:hypothetical protein
LQFYKARCHPTSLLPRPQDAPRRPLGLPTISRLIPTPPGTFQICVRSSHMLAPHLLMSKKAMQRVHGLWRLPGANSAHAVAARLGYPPSILQSLAGATVLMCLPPVSIKTSCCTSRHGSSGLCLPTTHHNCLRRSIRRVRFCDPCFRSHGLKRALSRTPNDINQRLSFPPDWALHPSSGAHASTLSVLMEEIHRLRRELETAREETLRRQLAAARADICALRSPVQGAPSAPLPAAALAMAPPTSPPPGALRGPSIVAHSADEFIRSSRPGPRRRGR